MSPIEDTGTQQKTRIYRVATLAAGIFVYLTNVEGPDWVTGIVLMIAFGLVLVFTGTGQSDAVRAAEQSRCCQR
jgi:hypothetical protein